MAPEWTWCSCHSPGTVSGNFMARRVPPFVPVNNMRPDRDITHCVKTISLAGTSRRICAKGNNKNIIRNFKYLLWKHPCGLLSVKEEDCSIVSNNQIFSVENVPESHRFLSEFCLNRLQRSSFHQVTLRRLCSCRTWEHSPPLAWSLLHSTRTPRHPYHKTQSCCRPDSK